MRCSFHRGMAAMALSLVALAACTPASEEPVEEEIPGAPAPLEEPEAEQPDDE